MIPKIIHQTAPTKMLTPEERRLQRRVEEHMQGWTLRLWDDDDNERLMQEYFPQFVERFNAIKRGVVKADIVRCVYLHAFGGLYFDTDYKVLRPIEEHWLAAPCLLPISRNDDIRSPDFRICNSIMASVPGYPLWSDFIGEIFGDRSLADLGENKVELVTGPEGLTAFYKAHRDRYHDAVLPARRYFHPTMTMHGFSFERTYPSFGAHLCWGSWRSKSLLRGIKNVITRKVTSFT